ncbi:dephospho-CoA kinase [Xylariaceae sp. FL0804]|nr:dephospho-CoA kinase [Xylariaceae sp. FL0804]
MLFIGLTGSIATGKSTVSSILSSPPYSLPIIDADVLARQVVEPGTRGYRAIVEHFLPTTPDLLLPEEEVAAGSPEESGRRRGRPLNRAALGRRVFGDDPARARDRAALNAIVHPEVRRAVYAALLRCYARGCWAVVLDVPLLFESGWDRLSGVVAVVAVRDPSVQMRRLLERDGTTKGLTPDEARDRVRSQTDVRVKARRCEARGPGRGVVLWNDGGRDELRAQVDAAVARWRRDSPPWWHRLCLLCPPLGLAAAAWTYWQNVRINKRWRELELQEKAKL